MRLKPITTEKAIRLIEIENTLVFQADRRSKKPEIQKEIEEVFNEIQRSNMSKLGEGGQPIYREDGKVLKGPNYFKPNISEILDK